MNGMANGTYSNRCVSKSLIHARVQSTVSCQLNKHDSATLSLIMAARSVASSQQVAHQSGK